MYWLNCRVWFLNWSKKWCSFLVPWDSPENFFSIASRVVVPHFWTPMTNKDGTSRPLIQNFWEFSSIFVVGLKICGALYSPFRLSLAFCNRFSRSSIDLKISWFPFKKQFWLMLINLSVKSATTKKYCCHIIEVISLYNWTELSYD